MPTGNSQRLLKLTNTTAKPTINALRDIFSRYGLPEILDSVNGAQFTAKEYEQFCSNNGILHRTTAAYVVQGLKSAIKQAQLTNKDMSAVIAMYLLVYRNTPHSTIHANFPLCWLWDGGYVLTLDLLTSVEKRVEAR